MDAVIRSAVLGAGRRRLARPAPRETAPVPAPAQAVETLEQLKRSHEQELAAVRRELEMERGKLREAMAAEQAQALQEAAARGYEDGVAQGEAAGRASFDEQAGRLGAMLDGLHRARHDVLDEAEDTLVEIAFAAVCQLAGTDAVARAVVAHAVREAAARLRADESLTVLLHPDDLACLDEAERQWGNVEFTASPAVAVGGCMIDGGKGTLDARLEVQLARLCGALARAREAQRNGGGA